MANTRERGVLTRALFFFAIFTRPLMAMETALKEVMMKDYIYAIWFYIISVIIEVFFGYLAITAQGPIALASLGIVGLNTLIMLSLVFDANEEVEEES